MTIDDSSVPCLDQLDRLLTATEQHLQTLGLLVRDERKNAKLRAALELQKASENYRAQYDSYINEAARISQEHRAVTDEIRASLLPGVWLVIPDLEIAYPKTSGFGEKYEALRAEFPEDAIETDRITRWLPRLHTLLTGARENTRNTSGFREVTEASNPAGSESIDPAVSSNLSEQSSSEIPPRRRGPDLDKSRARQQLIDKLTGELATIHQQQFQHNSVEAMTKRYPDFKVWKILQPVEQRELFTKEFRPKHYAQRLVMRVHGITSLETLKKDRRKLKDARKK